MNATKRQHRRYGVGFLLGISSLLFFVLGGCGEKPAPVEPPTVAPVEAEAPKADHFLLCIDNSRSIRGQEQIIIRETAMLLADLAERGDRVTIITFGKQARVAAYGVMDSNQGRVRFKRKINKVIDFRENYSDIRAGLKTVADQLALPALDKYRPHLIVLSDGKLEPHGGRTADAFAEMTDLLGSQLAGRRRYAVVLGDKYTHDKIVKSVDGRPLTGKRVMEEYVASTPKHFFHARKLDQLLPITVQILNRTKGSSAIGKEAKSTRFRIDSTVQSMTLVIRKRSLNGTVLCTSADIRIIPPVGAPESSGETIYRSSDYRYFDLAVVRRPAEGIWSVSLENGGKPEVLSNIVTPVKLHHEIAPHYYTNEFALGRVWLYDASASKVLQDPSIQIKAQISTAKSADNAPVYLDLLRDNQSGQFFLEMPGDVMNVLSDDRKDNGVTLSFIAQRFKPGTTELDPWFLRQSPSLSVSLVEPFIHWTQAAQRPVKWPFVSTSLIFGALLDPKLPEHPRFETPPRLQFVLERHDPERQVFDTIREITLDGQSASNQRVFKTPIELGELPAGAYRYRYRLADSVLAGGGAFTLASPTFSFQVTSYAADSWPFWAVCGGVLVIFLFSLSGMTAKMQGTMSTNGASQMVHGKMYASEISYRNRFTLKAKKLLFVKSAIVLKVTAGFVKVDGQLVGQGQSLKLYPAQRHTIEHDEGNKKIERQLMINV